MQARHRVGLPQPQAPQGRGVGREPVVVDLRGAQHHRPVGPAQHACDGLVGGRGPDGGVDDEHHRVGGAHRELGLGGDGSLQAGRVGLPAAGVDEGEPAAVPQRVVGDAVAGDAGDVLHDGLAAPDEPVDQRRLADVGPPDDRQRRRGRRGVPAVARRVRPLLVVGGGEVGRVDTQRGHRRAVAPVGPCLVHVLLRTSSSSATSAASEALIVSVAAASSARPFPAGAAIGSPTHRSTRGRHRRDVPGAR